MARRMRRRDLFKWTAAGSALLLPPLIPKPVTYFLAPYGGWGAQRLRIRKVQQYCINMDTEPVRYDATWDMPGGGAQFYTIMEHEDDAYARYFLEDKMRSLGATPNSEHFHLALPQGILVAEYI